MTNDWKQLYNRASQVVKPHELSDKMHCGTVGAAVLAESGEIYLGICIDTSSSLGMCAERNALSTMFTNGEYMISRVVAVNRHGKVLPPCGACREFMMQLGACAGSIEVLLNNQGKVARLTDLMPE